MPRGRKRRGAVVAGDGQLAKAAGVPLYRQIHELIRFRISKGEYARGTQIPSENELCRELGVSRVTLREALRKLVRERMLVTVPGKGTYVAAEAAKGITPVKYAGFLEDLQERVMGLNVVGVESARAPATDELKSVLRLDPDESEIILLKRLRHIENEPFSYTLNYLPLSIGSRIRPDRLFTVPLLKILREELDIPILRAQETIAAAPADPDVAQKLDVPVLYPVMHMKRLMFTTGDRPFELVETYYRADKYHYSVKLTRVKRNGQWRWKTEVETSA
jgi:DNA-binding GntR family transcriptional regulator